MSKFFALALVLVLCSPAFAQTTTRCKRDVWGGVVCKTEQDWWRQPYEALHEAMQMQAQVKQQRDARWISEYKKPFAEFAMSETWMAMSLEQQKAKIEGARPRIINTLIKNEVVGVGQLELVVEDILAPLVLTLNVKR